MEEVDFLGVFQLKVYIYVKRKGRFFFFSIRNCRLFYAKMSVTPISSDPTPHAHTF